MKLTVHDDLASQIGTAVLRYDKGAIPQPLKSEATVSTGYTDITSLANWDLLGSLAGLSYKVLRNLLITDFVGSWGTLSDADKKILVRHHIYPTATTTEALDALWTASERQSHRHDVIDSINDAHCTVRESSVAGSEKLICVQFDDSAVQSTSELATDTIL